MVWAVPLVSCTGSEVIQGPLLALVAEVCRNKVELCQAGCPCVKLSPLILKAICHPEEAGATIKSILVALFQFCQRGC